jgi:cation diffusion facilitator CzcD-associated flavoprotein CzcO
LEETDTVVIGASAAGLATAACLSRASVPFVLVEQEREVGSAWRRHYDRLHLHTSKGLSGLPHFPFPRDVPRYPAREQVVKYLEDYAAHFQLAPRFGERVSSVKRDNEAWVTHASGGEWRSRHVVIATGYTRVPHRPSWPGLDGFSGKVMHSSEYKSGAAFAGKRVLVIGFGNSGGEIAIDLVEQGAKPTLSVRGAVNVVPRDFLGLPILAWGIALSLLPLSLADAIARLVSRLVFGKIEKLGLAKLEEGPMTQIVRRGRIPLLDVGTLGHIRKGEIAVVRGIESFTAAGARFEGGDERPFDVVVLATGYRPAVGDFLEGAPLSDTGAPPKSGAEVAPGLFFCGFHVAPTGMLREIAIEAKRVSAAIALRR